MLPYVTPWASWGVSDFREKSVMEKGHSEEVRFNVISVMRREGGNTIPWKKTLRNA